MGNRPAGATVGDEPSAVDANQNSRSGITVKLVNLTGLKLFFDSLRPADCNLEQAFPKSLGSQETIQLPDLSSLSSNNAAVLAMYKADVTIGGARQEEHIMGKKNKQDVKVASKVDCRDSRTSQFFSLFISVSWSWGGYYNGPVAAVSFGRSPEDWGTLQSTANKKGEAGCCNWRIEDSLEAGASVLIEIKKTDSSVVRGRQALLDALESRKQDPPTQTQRISMGRAKAAAAPSGTGVVAGKPDEKGPASDDTSRVNAEERAEQPRAYQSVESFLGETPMDLPIASAIGSPDSETVDTEHGNAPEVAAAAPATAGGLADVAVAWLPEATFEPPEPSVAEEWTCVRCTLLNGAASAECDACGAPRVSVHQSDQAATAHGIESLQTATTASAPDKSVTDTSADGSENLVTDTSINATDSSASAAQAIGSPGIAASIDAAQSSEAGSRPAVPAKAGAKDERGVDSKTAAAAKGPTDERAVGSSCLANAAKKWPSAQVGVFRRLLQNIVDAPEEPKYRRLTLGNPRVMTLLRMAPGCLEALQTLGWKKSVPEPSVEAEFLELPLSASIAPLVAALKTLEDVDTRPSTRSGALALQNQAALEQRRREQQEAVEQQRREEEERKEFEATYSHIVAAQDLEFQQCLLHDQLKDLLKEQGDLGLKVAKLREELEASEQRRQNAELRLERYGENPRIRAEAEAAQEAMDAARGQLQDVDPRLEAVTTEVLEKQELLTLATFATSGD